jgi:N-acetylglucosaminyldiphosphoundecaprenol N-acetyl-beta-D-mannosaminyltransferase
MDALLARAALRGWSVYFVGARPDVIEKTVEAEMARHPGLVVAGCHHGYWTPEEEADVVAEIARAKPTLLFVGLPSPRKEFFIADHASTMNVNFSMGVGGSFDVVAGVVDRAPTWMQRTGLEWAHRLRMEPRRLLKRYALGNPRFAAMVARASLSTRLASI